MKQVFHLVMLVSLVMLSACENYGKKVQVSEKTEVYIKNSATETDAKKLGMYMDGLSKEGNERSVQLSKENNIFTVRMVVPQEKLAADPSLDESFKALRFLFADKVFPGSAVKLILTDNKFNDYKTVKDTVYAE